MSYDLRREGEVLHLRRYFAYRLMHLFSHRQVEVDGRRRRIVVEEYVLGFLRNRREIPFDRVESLEYGFEAQEHHRGNVQGETYSVGVELRDPFEIVTLAEFHGIGSTGAGMAPAGGVNIGGGDPKEGSREVLAHLEDLLGISLSFDAPRVGSLEESPYRCTECERPSPSSRETCQYCGGTVKKIEA